MANGKNPGGDGDATKTAGKGDAEPDNKQPAANGDSTDGDEGGKGGESEKTVTMSQKDLDALIARRISRATKDADEKAKLSETELLQRERDAAIAKANQADARDSFISQLKGVEYSAASRLFKLYAADLEFDDKGKPENLADIIKTAKSDWPDLFKTSPKGGADMGDGNGDKGKQPGGNMNDAIRRAAGRK